MQGVFWKDIYKGSPNQFSKIPLYISKLFQIELKDNQISKKDIDPSLEAALAKFNKWKW